MSRLLFPLIALLAHHTLGDDCGSECMAATFLQHQHQIAARVRTDPAARELMFHEEPWSAADCEEAPWMCEAPFDCINSTGQVESWEKVLKRLAKPSGVNMQGWCYAGSPFYKPARQCLATRDLHGYAESMLQFSHDYKTEEFDASYCFMSGHCQNLQVTSNSTLLEAEAICDERYGGPDGWRSVGLGQFPQLPPWKYLWDSADQKDVDIFVILSCAMGNYHCDVNYCHETYCAMESYKKKYQHLAPTLQGGFQ